MASRDDEEPSTPTRQVKKRTTISVRRSTRLTPAKLGKMQVTSTPKPAETETELRIQSESRYNLRPRRHLYQTEPEPTQPVAPVDSIPVHVKPDSPGWMQLGYAELFLALFLVVLIGMMLWYYHNFYNLDKK